LVIKRVPAKMQSTMITLICFFILCVLYSIRYLVKVN